MFIEVYDTMMVKRNFQPKRCFQGIFLSRGRGFSFLTQGEWRNENKSPKLLR